MFELLIIQTMFEWCTHHWTGILNTAQTIAIATGTYYAARGFNQWEKELRGRRKLELAEEVANLFSQFPSVISYIRNPLSRVDEGESLVKTKGEITPGHVTFERINKYKDYFSKIDVVRNRFIAYFGEDSDKYFIQGREILSELEIAARVFMHQDHISDENFNKYSNTIWWHSNEDDINLRVKSIKNGILSICLPIIRNANK